MTIWDNIETLLSSQCGPSTIVGYQRDCNSYLRWAKEQGKEPLDSQTLLSWRDDMSLHTTLSPNTINRYLSSIKRVVLEARRHKLIDRDTALDFQDVTNVKVRSLKSRLKNARTRIAPADMRRLCEAPDTSTLIGLRDHAMLLTLASSGGRASEVASLTLDQIRPTEDGKHYFIEINGKTDIAARDAHLSAEAHTAIGAWLEARNAKFQGIATNSIFTSLEGNRHAGSQISETTVWRIVKRYAGDLGIKNIKPHDFRRFVGTQIAKKKDGLRKAQKALGHKDIQTTAKHYILDDLEAGETENMF